jgi:hypothetical protein
MNHAEYLTDPYELKISFSRNSPDPGRIFSSMSDFIRTLEQVDRDLIDALDTKIETILLLDGVEASSLKSILRSAIRSVDDEALKDGDWKKAVGRLLLVGKYQLLEFLSERNEITDRSQILTLQEQLTKFAEQTDIKRIPSYSPVSTQSLLSHIGNITEAMSRLSHEDAAFYTFDNGTVQLNDRFVFNREAAEALLTKETKTVYEELTVPVKKPDYLGNSMWDIRLREHYVSAKMDDKVWLERFQNRADHVRPGDSLRVILETQVSFGYHGEQVAVHYRIVKVHQVVPSQPYEKQLDL